MSRWWSDNLWSWGRCAICTLSVSVCLQGTVLVTSDFAHVDVKTQLPVGFEPYPSQETPGGQRTMVKDGDRQVLKMVDSHREHEVGIKRYFTVKKGRYYRAIVEAKLPETVKTPEGGVFAIQLRCVDGSERHQVSIQPVPGEYRKFSIPLRRPANTDKLAFFLYSARAKCGEILVRNFVLEDSTLPFPFRGVTQILASQGRLEPTAEFHDDLALAGGKSISVKRGADPRRTGYDVAFHVRSERKGRYAVTTVSALDEIGRRLKAGSKFDSLMTEIAIDGKQTTRRVINVPWRKYDKSYRSVLGKFDFTGEVQTLTLRLPEGVRLAELQISPYRPPAVPAGAVHYVPPVLPSPAHPRLWVTPSSLPLVRGRLEQGENKRVWKWVQAQASKPYPLPQKYTGELRYDTKLEQATIRKAFVYLMTGNEALGKEAVELQKEYLSRVSFGNLLDITREIGAEIYAASLVFDWCFPLLSDADKTLFHKHLMRLADDMEIGWPPFRQMIVNGHGNEAQVNRDLLSMGIALHGIDNGPYRYCAYRIFEELIPMRAREYESGRHNQGYSYAGFRFAWEMHGAWLLRRMAGKEIYPASIKKMGRYWLYGRLPDNGMFPDGDGTASSYRLAALTMYSYAADPVMKGEFLRQGNAWRFFPVLYLLLNDPDLKAAPSKESLALAEETGDLMPSMTIRTGWQVKRGAGDVVVQMMGGGVNFGGHQHANAGAFQIYYRGMQAVDLGQYHFFGTPYDVNFNKRSISKNVILVYDPKDPWYGKRANDGGQRWPHPCPTNVTQMTRKGNFTGAVLGASIGPSPHRPLYGVYNLDLAAAYSKKVSSYVRDFVFLNLGESSHPAVLLVCDWVETSKADLKKYWQINTYDRPMQTANGMVSVNRRTGRLGRMYVDMFWPKADNREVTVVGGSKYQDVFGKKFLSPKPDLPSGKGYRTMVSPKKPSAKNLFVNVISLSDRGQGKLPVTCVENDPVLQFDIKNYLVTVPRDGRPVNQKMAMQVPVKGRRILATHLQPGPWTVMAPDGKAAYRTMVEKRAGTIFLETTMEGLWTLTPGDKPALAELPKSTLKACSLQEADETIRLDDNRVLLKEVEPVLKAVGITARETGNVLELSRTEDVLTLTSGKMNAILNNQILNLPAPVKKETEGWKLPLDLIAQFSRCKVGQDVLTDDIQLMPTKRDGITRQIFCFEANKAFSQERFWALLNQDNSDSGYWAARRGEATFDIVFFRPQMLSGVGFRWLLGNNRKNFFKLEISSDGKTFTTVYDGASSGKTTDFEDVTFNQRPVIRVRFTGKGNTKNDWTSIMKMRLLK